MGSQRAGHDWVTFTHSLTHRYNGKRSKDSKGYKAARAKTNEGERGRSDRFYFLGLQNHCGRWWQSWNQKMFIPCKDSYDQPRHHIEKQRHHFADEDLPSQSYCFSSSHVWMWELVKAGHWRRLSTEELMLLDYCAGEDSQEFLVLKGDQTCQS